MTALEDLPYSIADHDIVSEADGMRVQVMTIGPGEAVPWHYHTIVTDVFVGLEGTVVIETRAPRARHELAPGDHCVVPPMTAHMVSGKDGRRCRVTLVQGVGEHDFNPVGAARAQD
ncbi:MAG: cupin domain-containing protein [Rhodospirillales bacterium]|nr:cupin domain-containing protein [Rhodospirillales bacterium]